MGFKAHDDQLQPRMSVIRIHDGGSELWMDAPVIRTYPYELKEPAAVQEAKILRYPERDWHIHDGDVS